MLHLARRSFQFIHYFHFTTALRAPALTLQPMTVNHLCNNPGAFKKAKRLGRGPGSGKGKTSGRGHKGHNARSGGGNIFYINERGASAIWRRLNALATATAQDGDDAK